MSVVIVGVAVAAHGRQSGAAAPGHGFLGKPIDGWPAFSYEAHDEVGPHAIGSHMHPVSHELVGLLLGKLETVVLGDGRVHAAKVKAGHARCFVHFEHDDR